VSVDPLKHQRPQTAEEAWLRLQTGNKRFQEGNASDIGQHVGRMVDPASRVLLANGQHPFALVVTCCDSRITPELVFCQSLGDLFVVRAAGNVVDTATLASIEYGITHLHIELLVIMGHEGCGAVSAAVDQVTGANHSAVNDLRHLGKLLERIKPSAELAVRLHPENRERAIALAIELNAKHVKETALEQCPAVNALVCTAKVKVVTCVYSLGSGIVRECP